MAAINTITPAAIPAIAPPDSVEVLVTFTEGVSVAFTVALWAEVGRMTVVDKADETVLRFAEVALEDDGLVLVVRATRPPSVETIAPSPFSTIPLLLAQHCGLLSQQ